MRKFRTFREREARLEAWRHQARILCAEALGPLGSEGLDVTTLADTIVGMFDAGARDEEVITFLRGAETRHFGDERLSDSDRRALARALHRAAAEAPN
jgi:hypothetical protein